MFHSGIRPIIIASAIAAFATPLISISASAQQNDREKAWHECLVRVNAAQPKEATGDNDQARTAAFKACMASKGIRP
jgi:hypothetical protein